MQFHNIFLSRTTCPLLPSQASTGDLAHSSSALNSSLGKSHNGVVCSHTMLGPAFHLSSATSLTQQQPEPVGGREISSEGSASWSTPHLQTSGGLGQWMHRMAQNIINSANSFNQGHAQRPQGGSINLKDVTQRSASTQGVTPHVSFASSLGEDTGSLAPSLGANGGVGSCRLARQHNEHAQHVAPYPMQRQESAAQLTMKPASGNLLTQDGLQAVHVIAVPQAPMLDEVGWAVHGMGVACREMCVCHLLLCLRSGVHAAENSASCLKPSVLFYSLWFVCAGGEGVGRCMDQL